MQPNDFIIRSDKSQKKQWDVQFTQPNNNYGDEGIGSDSEDNFLENIDSDDNDN